jgi:4-amino-4-deoxy-L-arabinose transferase-like glycosyltransferase
MNIFVYSIMTIVFVYTAGFGVSLWKEKNKAGSVVVFLVALVVVVTPFFTLLK